MTKNNQTTEYSEQRVAPTAPPTKPNHHPKTPRLRFGGFEGEWEEKKLGEVATFSKGKGLSKKDIVENGKNECVHYGELFTKYNEVIDSIKSKTNTSPTNSRLSKENDILMPTSDVTPNGLATASALSKEGVILGGDILIIRSKNILNKFFAYWVSVHKKEIMRLVVGVTVYHIYGSDLATLKIKFPPLPEQEKIASFLSVVDEWVENLKGQKEDLEKYKKGVMQKLFPAKGEQVPQLRFSGFTGNWEEKKLGEVGEIKTGTTPPTKNKEYYEDGKFLWVTPTDITDSKDIKITERKLSDVGIKKGRLIKGGSVLVTCIASIGKNAILREDGSCNQQINSITPNNKNNVDFIYYLIERFNNKLFAFAGGGGMLILNKKDFSDLKFLFPPLPEQEKIASFLTALDDIIEKTEQKISQAEQWKKGLMQRLFV